MQYINNRLIKMKMSIDFIEVYAPKPDLDNDGNRYKAQVGLRLSKRLNSFHSHLITNYIRPFIDDRCLNSPRFKRN